MKSKLQIHIKNLKKNTQKTFFIAEIGVNHNGKLSLAKKMILSAKKSGADANMEAKTTLIPWEEK